ncbi:MAG TPA: hypothetical protein PK939_07800, partial [Bacteroidales bacterium]|nr:hypothetical protein [Bacteroidales bacterium]
MSEKTKREPLKALKVFPAILLLLIGSHVLAQHKEYSFNNPGNECFMDYICYSPDGVYQSIKRPFVFIVGKTGETAIEAFQSDSLYNEAQFQHYMFVFLPGNKAGQQRQPRCIESLASLLTYNYYYGHDNLFLKLRDTSMSELQLQEAKMNNIFA